MKNLRAKLEKCLWWTLYRFHPSHKYHIIDTGLRPGYHDPDCLIYHATFKLFCEWLEEERKWPMPEGDDNWVELMNDWEEIYNLYKSGVDEEYNEGQKLFMRVCQYRPYFWYR